MESGVSKLVRYLLTRCLHEFYVCVFYYFLKYIILILRYVGGVGEGSCKTSNGGS